MRRDKVRREAFLCGQDGGPGPQTNFSFVPALIDWRGEQFLANSRVHLFRSRGREAVHTRTGLRAGRGHVHTRWHEALMSCAKFA